MSRGVERAVIVAAAAYLLVTGWAMARLSYDVWGALVMTPVIGIFSWLMLRRVFSGDRRPLLRLAVIGLFAKLAGCLIRYWVAFSAYGGNADAQRYHNDGKLLAGAIRQGTAALSNIVPRGTGTLFMSRLTATLYTFVGSSKLAAFLLFGWFGYWGAVCFLLAAIRAVPGLAVRRYAAMMFLAPSLVFWPSSIGKEAFMMGCLGAATLGSARLLTGRWGGATMPLLVGGLLGAGLVRPHFAAIWVAGLVTGLAVSMVTRTNAAGRMHRVRIVAVLAVGVVALVGLAGATLRYLNESTNQSDNAPVVDKVTAIFDATAARTTQGGSSFTPVAVHSPLDWPLAIVRTLTRPLLVEASSAAALLPAVEMTVFLALALVGWRRIANLPLMLRRCPYVVFAAVVLMMWGLAFASIGNLGILARERSLVVPLLALLVCVPARQRRTMGAVPHPRSLPPRVGVS
jgi:hypothetical protein